MVKGLWGKKVGMTQVFAGNKAVPVTVIDVAHWVITRIKTQEKDGYNAVQIARVRDRFIGKEFAAEWLKKPRNYFSLIREVKTQEIASDMAVGNTVNFHAQVATGEFVDVFGRTKGCGFAGVVRRHDFNGPPASHGHTMGKKTGSLSFMRSRGRVIKGKRMPGHLGNVNRVMRGLEVVKVEADAHIILVKGSVPGKSGSLVFIRKA
ncbi:MAG TPA: 50S ribosomal protein L3 [Candidatus Limnocylindria bacterium]|nr:50S ribosomal protein L3 [Candidatus Limnocylindria bacterium]